MKKIDLEPRSFKDTQYFPGCAGNPFDRALHALDFVENISPIILFFVLSILAILGSLPRILSGGSFFNWWTVTLFAFFLLDWLLIALLPVTRRSFGPIKVVVLMLAVLRLPFAFLPAYWNFVFESIGTLLVVYGFYFEPFQIDVHLEHFQSAKIKGNPSLHILQLGDLHLERTTLRERKVLQRIKEIDPDLILFTGDVLNLSYLTDKVSQADAIWFFNQLSAPLGVYCVSGSPAVDSHEFLHELAKKTALQWLDNEVVSPDTGPVKINLIGLTCTHNPDLDEQALSSMEIPQEGFNILLHHSPDLSPNASRFPIDLQLSGHTHGGQVRLPIIGALFTGSLYGKTFEAGRYLVNGMPLYITRGIGMEGSIAPRVRFLCKPEMMVFDLTRQNNPPPD